MARTGWCTARGTAGWSNSAVVALIAHVMAASSLLTLTGAAGPMDPWASAALKGDAKEVAKLLRTGGCPDGIDWQDAKYKHSALMVAAEGTHSCEVECSADCCASRVRTSDYNCPAARVHLPGGYTELSETLLEHGASTELRNAVGKSALDIALSAGSHGVTAALLRSGVAVTPPQAARLLFNPYCFHAIVMRAIHGDRTFAALVAGTFGCVVLLVVRVRTGSRDEKGQKLRVGSRTGGHGRKRKAR
jgi:hypothetical protein